MAKANQKTRLRAQEEGEMGIGTMIVFIAMVLVAAMAAGVLLQTAGLVQQQAQETGTRAIRDVSTGFVVLNILGDRASDPTATTTESSSYEDTLQFLEIKVSLLAGSSDVAMSNVVVEISDGYTVATLHWKESANYQQEWDGTRAEATSQLLKQNADADQYTAEELRDPENTYYETTTTENDNPDYIVTPGCIIRIFIDCAETGLSIEPQDHIFLKIIPKHGTPTYETFTAPEIYSERYIELF